MCVWNVSDKPADVVIDGLGKPKGVFAPGSLTPRVLVSVAKMSAIPFGEA